MDQTVVREFNRWIKKKKQLHFYGRNPGIRIGEIWWAGVGENVGVEINGKNKDFARPVIIFKVFGRYSFLAIPLTSQKKSGSWYSNFKLGDKEEYAALCQIRILSKNRLYRKLGEMSKGDFLKVSNDFKALFIDENLEIIEKNTPNLSIRVGRVYPGKYTSIISNLLQKIKRKLFRSKG